MDKKFLSLIFVLFLAAILFSSLVIFREPLRTFTRAAQESVPSSSSSLIFYDPVIGVKADGKSVANINVFIRNANNIPITNKTVRLETTLGQLKAVNPVTDKNGRAAFTLSSDTAGEATVSAFVDNNIELQQKITVKFE